MICLFPTLEAALAFNDVVDERIMKVKNRPEIFGEQLICNKLDEVVLKIDNLLSVATDISVDELPTLLREFEGICYPAHIDRDSNGIIAVLGALPETPHFNTVEIKDADKLDELSSRFALYDKNIVFSSDSHILGVMNDKDRYIDLDCERDNPVAVVRELLERLR